MGYIYCITNTLNNKKYVGKTTHSIEERFKEHCRDCHRNRFKNRPLYFAMNKYGIDNFKVELLEEVLDPKILSERELQWIKNLKTYGSVGYNASKGGDGKVLYNHKEIIKLASLGYTAQQIKKKLNCCIDIIYKVTKASGVKLRPNRCKLIALYDLAGNYIQTFFSSMDAIKYLKTAGVCKAANPLQASGKISDCCKQRTPSAYRYKWYYLPEPE